MNDFLMLTKIKKIFKKAQLLNNNLNQKISDKKKSDKLFAQQKSYFSGNNIIHDTEIGYHSYVSYNSLISNCIIGNYCSIGPNVVIGVGNHPTNMLSTSPSVYFSNDHFSLHHINSLKNQFYRRVTIKNDVWIGAGVFIRNGVSIGNAAIIGAGSVVLNDVPDYSIVGGVPSRLIKMRFEPEVIQILNQTAWWDYELVPSQILSEIVVDPSIVNVLRLKDYLKSCKKFEN